MTGPSTASRDRPIFILASGWRTGSTLVQRLLCSHPSIHIWGENGGMCEVLAGLYRHAVSRHESSARAAWDFHIRESDAWIANLNPSGDDLLNSIRALLERYYAAPTRAMGKARWGFKEVRHTLDGADFLRHLYPDARLLLLVRHPRDCLASARATQRSWKLLDEVGGPVPFLEHWERTARSFLRARSEACELLMRYEDVLANRQETLAGLGAFLGVDADRCRGEVFDTRRRGWSDDEPYLTAEDLAALESPDLREVAVEYGYEY